MITDPQMKKAVAALTAVIGANKANGLWEEGARMFCQVNLHRIPSLPNEKDTRVMVELEHSMWTDQGLGSLLYFLFFLNIRSFVKPKPDQHLPPHT